MYRWLVSRKVHAGFASLGQGDPTPILKLFRDGSHFLFPGDHSWALDTTDRSVVAAWFSRFAALHPKFTVHDVLVKGPPWKTLVAVHGEDRVDLPDGYVYRNEWAQRLRLSWGRVEEDRLYVDTQRVAAFDAHLKPAARGG
jgi:ketosteroid isomerase-like protein